MRPDAADLPAWVQKVSRGRGLDAAIIAVPVDSAVQQALTLELHAKGGHAYLVQEEDGFARRLREFRGGRPEALEALDPQLRWLGLEVRAHRPLAEDRAEVEFVARFRLGGRAVRQHERSRFVREQGHWFYVDGDDLSAPAKP